MIWQEQRKQIFRCFLSKLVTIHPSHTQRRAQRAPASGRASRRAPPFSKLRERREGTVIGYWMPPLLRLPITHIFGYQGGRAGDGPETERSGIKPLGRPRLCFPYCQLVGKG